MSDSQPGVVLATQETLTSSGDILVVITERVGAKGS